MEDSSNYTDRRVIIFIGKFASSESIIINRLPTLLDTFLLSTKVTQPNDPYHYLVLKEDQKVYLTYQLGSQTLRGYITFKFGRLQVTMTNPQDPLLPFFIIKGANRFSLLYYSPNNKIRKKTRDLHMVMDEMKSY